MAVVAWPAKLTLRWFHRADHRAPPKACLIEGHPRTVFLHYRLFKCAGTSIQETLRENFCDGFVESEFSLPRTTDVPPYPYNAGAVAEWLEDHPHVVALSSHTALPPLPRLLRGCVIGIVVVRHPIDRLHSAYLFERRQQSDSYGARLAKQHDFAGYLQELFAHPVDRSARNNQTYRLSFNEPPHVGTELDRALRVIDDFEVVGTVERFADTIAVLQIAADRAFTGFEAMVYQANVRRTSVAPLSVRLAAIQEELGDAFYREVCAANEADLELHAEATARLDCEVGSRHHAVV